MAAAAAAAAFRSKRRDLGMAVEREISAAHAAAAQATAALGVDAGRATAAIARERGASMPESLRDDLCDFGGRALVSRALGRLNPGILSAAADSSCADEISGSLRRDARKLPLAALTRSPQQSRTCTRSKHL